MIKVASENNNYEETGIVILSHGTLAKGLFESAKLFFGEYNNAVAVCLEADDDPSEYGSAVEEEIAKFKGHVVVLVDLFGGTPCNQITMLFAKNKYENVEVYSGANLPMMMDLLCKVNGVDADFSGIGDAAKEGIVNVSEQIKAMMG